MRFFDGNNVPRLCRWMLTLLLILTLSQIPIYIYVLEIHSANLARIEERLVRVETLLTVNGLGR